MNSSSNTTFFTANSTAPTADKSRATVRISIEEFEDLMEYKRICQTLFEEFKEELLHE